MAVTTSNDIRPAAVSRTCELFGVVDGHHIIPFEDVLFRFREGRVEPRPGVRLSLGLNRRDGHRLSGVPGCWPEVYPDTSPTAFGLDADLGVVSWDARARRAVAVSAEVLQQLFGQDWREQLRKVFG